MAKKDYIWSDFNQEKLNTFCDEAFSGNFGSITISSFFPTQNFRRLKELLGVDDITVSVTYTKGAGMVQVPSFYFCKINDNWLWFVNIPYQAYSPDPYVAVKKRTTDDATITFTSNASKYFRLKTQKSTGEYTQDTIDKVTSITFTIDCTESSTDWCNFNSSTGTITYNYKGDYCRFKEFNHSTDLEIWNAYLWDGGKQLFNSTYFESTNVKVSATQPTIPSDRFNYDPSTLAYQAALPTIGYYGFGSYLYKFLNYPYSATHNATSGHYIFSNPQSYTNYISGKDDAFWAIRPTPKFQFIGHSAIQWINETSFTSNGYTYYLKPGQKVIEFQRHGANETPIIIEQNATDSSAYGGPAFVNDNPIVNNNGATVLNSEYRYPLLYLDDSSRPALKWYYQIEANPYWLYREHTSGGDHEWTDVPSWAEPLFHEFSTDYTYWTTEKWNKTIDDYVPGYDNNRAYRYILSDTELEIGLSIKLTKTKIIRHDTADYNSSIINFLSLSQRIWSSPHNACNIITLWQSFNIINGILDEETLNGIHLIGQNNRGSACHYRTYGQTGKGYSTIEDNRTYTNRYTYAPNSYADFRMRSSSSKLSRSYYYIYDENGVDE